MGLLLLSSGLAAGCQGTGQGSPGQASPGIRLTGVTFRVYRDGRLAADGQAAAATYRRDSGDLVAEAVDVAFPGGEGPAPRLAAPRVRGNTRSRDLVAEGGLRMERGPDVATTEEARYDPDDRLVHGAWPVQVRGTGWTLDGPGFLLDPASGRLQIGGGVRLEVRQPPGEAGR